MGHTTENCQHYHEHLLSHMEVENIGDHPNQVAISSPTHKPEEVEDFGSWILVKKPVKKRTTLATKVARNAGKAPEGIIPNTIVQNHKTLPTRIPAVHEK